MSGAGRSRQWGGALLPHPCTLHMPRQVEMKRKGMLVCFATVGLGLGPHEAMCVAKCMHVVVVRVCVHAVRVGCASCRWKRRVDVTTCLTWLTHRTLWKERRMVAMVMMAVQMVMRMSHLVGLRKKRCLCSLACSWSRYSHSLTQTHAHTHTLHYPTHNTSVLNEASFGQWHSPQCQCCFTT